VLPAANSLTVTRHAFRVDFMNIETIREWLNRQPFEPFEVRLSNGEVHQVRHPENVALGKTRIVIAYPDPDRVVHCSLIHINSIQALQAA
jgi:hypothetical protein